MCIKKMHIKTTTRYHSTPMRTAKIKNTGKTRAVWVAHLVKLWNLALQVWGRGEHVYLLMDRLRSTEEELPSGASSGGSREIGRQAHVAGLTLTVIFQPALAECQLVS